MTAAHRARNFLFLSLCTCVGDTRTLVFAGTVVLHITVLAFLVPHDPTVYTVVDAAVFLTDEPCNAIGTKRWSQKCYYKSDNAVFIPFAVSEEADVISTPYNVITNVPGIITAVYNSDTTELKIRSL